MDAPQGQVVVRTCQGSLHCLLTFLGEELVALGEYLVVIHEKGLAMLRGVLDADPNSKPGPVGPLGHERLQDPIMHMLHIGRSTISMLREPPISRGVNLLGLNKGALLGQGLLNSLGQLLELPLVHILPKGRRPQLACHM